MSEKENKDYKIIIDLLKEARDDYNLLKDSIMESLNVKYNIKGNPLESILKFSKEEIEKLSVAEVLNYMSKYTDRFETAPTDKVDEVIEEARHAMIVIYDSAIVIFGARKKIEELEKEAGSIVDEYVVYASSDKIINARREKIAEFEKALEVLDDGNEIERRKIEKKVTTLKECLDFSFITKPFEKDCKKEVDSIISSFFDTRKGSIITDQFSKKIEKFGFDKRIYKFFFNLEENFLPKEYYPFNNLFLFIYMRFVRYSDPYKQDEMMKVQAITSAMSNLVYHKFPNTENEKKFVEVMRKTIDYFMDHRDEFILHNTTWCEHPARKEATERNEQVRKENLINKMEELGITGYDESLSANELQAYFNIEMEKILARHEAEAKQKLVSPDGKTLEEIESEKCEKEQEEQQTTTDVINDEVEV